MAQGVTFYAEATDVYVESTESAGTLDLLFSDATGKIPYVSLQDGLDFLYGEGEYTTEIKDKVFVVTRPNGAFL